MAAHGETGWLVFFTRGDPRGTTDIDLALDAQDRRDGIDWLLSIGTRPAR